MNAFLVGYDRICFVDSINTCPPSHRDYNYWCCQGQLILHAIIISSIDHHVVTMLGNFKISKQAQDILTKLFASKTRTRIMYLKKRLSLSTKWSQSILEYLRCIKSLADELAVINCSIDDVDLVIHTLNGLGSEFKEVSVATHTGENAAPLMRRAH